VARRPEPEWDPVIACPVPGCCERPVRNCDFCPEHQKVVNAWQMRLLFATPTDFGVAGETHTA
jgi:hypothetical protein